MKILLLLSLILSPPILSVAATGEPANNGSEIWEEIDVVPMPRQIALTGANPALDPLKFALIVGENPLRQSELGAEWINKRLVKMGGEPLPILKTNQELGAGVTPIIIGSREDNPKINEAAENELINIGEGNPGPRGYEILFTKDGAVLLAGADPIGVLYACVTLGELIQEVPEGLPILKAANIRDWPDIQYLYVLDMEPPSDVVKNPDSPEARASYLSKMSRMYENMLRRKLSMVWYKPLAWGEMAFREMSPYAKETVRMGIEAGKELGIESLFYHLYPFVGPRKDHPDVDPDLLEQKPKTRYDTWLQSWTMDEERRAYAKELAQWIKEMGFTDIGFHDTDTGGYLNPANWNNRGPADRKRWGDDYAAATINKFQIFFEEIVRENPEVRINFTLYPYTSEIFDPSEVVKKGLRTTLNLSADQLEGFRKRYESFWTQMNASFPKEDVAFAIREPWSANGEPGLKVFLDLVKGRPLFAWYGLAAAEFYSNVPSWLGTLHSGSPDDIVFTQNIYVDRGYVPLLSYAMREYSWNTKAPGAASFQSRDRAKMSESAAGDTSTASYTVMLPHLVRNYFGRTLAPDITRAIQQNVSPFIVFGGRPDRNIVDETEPRMNAEAARATVAAEALDAAWLNLGGAANSLNLDADVFARVAYLRQVFHSTKLVARVKEAVYRSQKLSSLNRFDEAMQAVDEAKAILETGQAELVRLQEEGPAAVDGVACSAKVTIDKTLPLLSDLLTQRTASITASRKYGGIPTRVLSTLAEEKELPVAAVEAAPKIDGEVNDPVWRKSYPQEAWFLSGSEGLVAEAETRFSILADDKNLYVGFKCWTVIGQGVGLTDADREFVRIYIKRPESGQKEMLAFAIWANGKIESTDRELAALLKSKVTVGEDSWQGELQIPLTALGASSQRDQCRIGFLRSYNRFGVNQTSSPIPLDSAMAGSFEAARPHLEKLPLAIWNAPAFSASARVSILEPKVREVTLDDRIATIVDFGINADSDCLLDHVTIEVEAVNADGVTESRQEILSEPSMKYNLRSLGKFRATFLQAVKKGSIRVTLHSDQVQKQTEYRFGADPAASGE